MFVGVVVVALVLGGVAVALAGLGRGSLEDERPDAADTGLPDRTMQSSDVERLRFPIALRGYRMAEVDEALEHLSAALAVAEQRLEAQAARIAAVTVGSRSDQSAPGAAATTAVTSSPAGAAGDPAVP